MNDDATSLIGRDWASFLDLLDGAGWETPTRLEGWSVEDLARHVHWGMTLEADALELLAARSVGGAAAAAGAVGQAGEAAGPAGEASRVARGEPLEAPREQIVPALRSARARLLRALAAAPSDPAAPVPMPYGDMPLAFALQIFVMEAAVHRSDLAHAVGVDDRLGPGTHAAAASVLQAFWPVLAADATAVPPAGTGFLLRGASVSIEAEYDGAAWAAPTGPHAVVISGDDDAVLLAGYGRLPVEAARVRIAGDVALARRLKEYVPGP
ncbi:maleylpyruvate isomerase family mycothiol-dependent enzyme [Georgenia sp. EYE_87]|uniref:maleylpyruvate isomerase family mycothiol-dependent enzyme n=1 Tax=Georgenia sp. EYE_87 TaxID=2853448 RepID=UPI002003C58C|nr:maleylpyruvate isomerase family mycothiol-dependent enzyme [Georgenia sp. EYE_87]MCK6210043.1 maleylpyruvate isomerase family mycothiol-dependent enzyme [Georgenia sp. EYE_87]